MKIFFGWEIGMGMGHLSPHLPLFEELVSRGHELHIAARDVQKAAKVFSKLANSIWQAPVEVTPPKKMIAPTPTMAQSLQNAGWGTSEGISARMSAWNCLLDNIQPEFVICDYAPTLHLALRERDLPTVSLSHGFVVPPRADRLDPYWPFKKGPEDDYPKLEEEVLGYVNAALRSHGKNPVDTIARVFHEGLTPLLETFPKLDHHKDRKGGIFVGPPPSPRGGASPIWPEVSGPKLWGYLKQTPGMPEVLKQLRSLGHPTLIVADSWDERLIRDFSGGNLRITTERVDLWKCIPHVDLVLTNASQATVAHALLEGKPLVSFPIYLEQQLLAGALNDMGTGLAVDPKTGRATSTAVRRVLEDPSFRVEAKRFADETPYSMESYLGRALAEIEKVAAI